MQDDDLLADWPYATRYLLNTLDPFLIEKHAVSILCRALNIGRLTGFVGAGGSMAYGRITWRDLVQQALEEVITTFDGIPDSAKTKRMESLYQTVKFLNKGGPNEVDGDRLPMRYQLCEELDNAMQNFKDPKNNKSLREKTKAFTIDDSGHASRILKQGLFAPERGVSQDDFDPKGLASGQSRRALFSHQTCRLLWGKWCDASKTPLAALVAAIRAHCERREPRGSALLPTDRYIVEVLLRCLPLADGKQLIVEQSALADAIMGEPTRHELIPEYRDPLLLLYERLRITRYLTTNYDGEIEKLLKEVGLRRRSPSDDSLHADRAASTLANPSRSAIVFSRNTIGELTAFASLPRTRSGSVVHLHGRSGPGKSRTIIVTEADYQRQYVAQDEVRDLVDNAIRLAFGSSPLLFVGSNMGEDDILRPLRQFMSTTTRLEDRVAIALIPSIKKSRRQTEEKISLLGRYGVYAIHFGKAGMRADGEKDGTFIRDPAERDSRQADWLGWVSAIAEELKTALDIIAREIPAKPRPLDPPFADQMKSDLAKANLAIATLIDGGPAGKPDNVAFTTAAAGGSDRKELVAPNLIESVDADLEFETRCTPSVEAESERHLSIAFEVDVINAVTEFCRLMDGLCGSTQEAERRQWAGAARAALTGAYDSLLTIFTCARLIRVRWEWDSWSERWFRLPEPRRSINAPVAAREVPASTERVSKRIRPGAAITARHALALSFNPEDEPEKGRFYAHVPSQSLKHLVSALNRDTDSVEGFRRHRGRRILLLTARRGVGKGHFFSSLQDVSEGGNFDVLLDALAAKGAAGDNVEWDTIGFFNLSWSHEIMSVFDRIALLLHNRTSELCADSPTTAAALKRGWDSLAEDRLGKLRFALSSFTKAAESSENKPALRTFIGINSFGALFDQNGEPKNGEIKRILSILLDPAFKEAPVDFFLVCDEARIPALFRKAGLRDSFALSLLHRDPLDERNRRLLKEREQTLDLAEQKAKGVPDAFIAVHNLHEARAAVITAAFFTRVGLLITRHRLAENRNTWERLCRAAGRRPNEDCTYHRNMFFADSAAVRVRRQFQAWETLATQSGLDTAVHIPLLVAHMLIVAELNNPTDKGDPNTCLDHLLKAFVERSPDVPDASPIERLRSCSEVLLRELAAENPEAQQEDMRALLDEAAKIYNQEMRTLFDAVHRGRYMLTLVLAAAYETTASLTNEVETNCLESKIRFVAKDCVRFLERVRASVVGAGPRRYSDLLIEETLALYRRHHEQREFSPIRPSDGSEPVRLVPEEFRLLQDILWHLSVIGQPTELEVLATCPRIREAVALKMSKAAKGGPQIPSDKDVRDAVNDALGLAIFRCLVFRVRGAVDRDKGGDEPERFTVHSLVQRYFYERMGAAAAAEYLQSDQFTVSMYATQPDDAPKLSAEARSEIFQVLCALVSYPGGAATSDWKPGCWGPPGPGQDASVLSRERKRLLRAAYGIVRSVYSVAVIARFDAFTRSEHDDVVAIGHMEEHRRLVRWMSHLAAKFWNEKSILEGESGPFYDDEIVWLYNECAVLSLAEGRLADATQLFTVAHRAAGRLENSDVGPLRLRILLNRSLVDIERGDIARARSQLKPIATIEPALEHAVPPMLAIGYLGLIDHIEGDYEAARDKYNATIEGLQQLKRSRALSIFCRHFGDLLRELDADSAEAEQMLARALRHAQEGSHEDQRYHAIMSSVRLRVKHGDVRIIRSVQDDLDAAERYALAADMPRLLAEIFECRGMLYQRLGDSRLAAAAATSCVEISSLHDLRLRKINGLLLLADIYVQRGRPDDAQPVVRLAAEMAKSVKYYAALQEVRKLEQAVFTHSPR